MKKTLIDGIIYPGLTLSLRIALDLYIGAKVLNEYDNKELSCIFISSLMLSTTLFAMIFFEKDALKAKEYDSFIEIVTPLLAPYLANSLEETSITSLNMLKHQSFGILIEVIIIIAMSEVIVHLNWIRNHVDAPKIIPYLAAIQLC